MESAPNGHAAHAAGQTPGGVPPVVRILSNAGDGDSEPVAIRHRRHKRTKRFVKVRPDDPHPVLPFCN